MFSNDSALAFGIIPELKGLGLSADVLAQVQDAFASGLHVVWRVMAGVCGFALLSCVMMKGLPLHTKTDKSWGVKEKKGERKVEEGGGSEPSMPTPSPSPSLDSSPVPDTRPT